MLHEFSRTELLIGKDGLDTLKKSKVAIFGIGGVGSFTVEGLARCGIGHFILVDDDKICLTNLNRQLHATRKTVGRPKVDVMAERILEINPDAQVEKHPVFYLPDSEVIIIQSDVDYIVDAVDTVSAKIALVMKAQALHIPIISCMGAGNKLDPTQFEVADIYETSVDPLCRVMRRELKKRGIPSLKVVYSREEPLQPQESEEAGLTRRRHIPGSISFVPSVAGLIMAGEVVKDLIQIKKGAQKVLSHDTLPE